MSSTNSVSNNNSGSTSQAQAPQTVEDAIQYMGNKYLENSVVNKISKMFQKAVQQTKEKSV